MPGLKHESLRGVYCLECPEEIAPILQRQLLGREELRSCSSAHTGVLFSLYEFQIWS